MNNPLKWRDSNYSSWLIITLAAFFLFLSPLAVFAQNNTPSINSQPTLVVTTDQEYRYQVTAVDADADDLSYSLISGPEGMALVLDTLTWQPTKVGMYNAVIEVSDQNNGFDTQSWKITVNHGDASKLTITPDKKPTNVDLGNNKQFSVRAFDQYDNPITDPEVTWSTDENFSTINQQGLLLANKGGITFAAAAVGEANASVGVVVVDIRNGLVNNQAEVTTTEVTEEVATEKNEEAKETTEENEENDVSKEENNAEEETLMSESTENEEEGAAEEDGECQNINHSLTFILLIVYGILLIIYFVYEKKNKSTGWWILPFLLTFIGLIIYYKNFCAQTYLWWPWVLVGIGVALTWYFQGRKNKSPFDHDDSQSELPF